MKLHPHRQAHWQTGKANAKGGLECLGFGGLCLTLILLCHVSVSSCRLNSCVNQSSAAFQLMMDSDGL